MHDIAAQILQAPGLGVGRIVAPEIETPNILANLVSLKWMNGSKKRPDPTAAPGNGQLRRTSMRAMFGSQARRSATARAGNRRFWMLSALRTHTKAPYKTDSLWRTLMTLKCPGRARTVVEEAADLQRAVPERHLGRDPQQRHGGLAAAPALKRERR